MSRSILRAIFFATPFLLAACAQQPEAPPPPSSSVPLTDRERAASQVHVDPAEAADLISHYRRDHGLSAVVPDLALQKFAQAQANAMASHDTLSHEIDGNLSHRLQMASLGQATAVENVSAGYFSLNDVIGGWRRSPQHNANLLDQPMRRIGIATAYAPGTRYKVYWSLVMSN